MNMEGSAREENVDAEADVVESLLTLRRMPSSTTGPERLRHTALPDQEPVHPAVEDLAGHARPDSSLPSNLAANAAHGHSSRPSSGAGVPFLAQRGNSFTGKKRKPASADDASAPRVPLLRAADDRQVAAAAAAEAAADAAEAAMWQLQQQLQVPPWHHAADTPFTTETYGHGQSMRVASEPLMNGGKRLPESVLAQLRLGSMGGASAELAAVERLRSIVQGPAAANGGSPPSAKRPNVGAQPSNSGGPSPLQGAGGGSEGAEGRGQGAQPGAQWGPDSSGGAPQQAGQPSRWQQQQQQRPAGRQERSEAQAPSRGPPPPSPSRLQNASDTGSDPGSPSGRSGGRRATDPPFVRPAAPTDSAAGRGGAEANSQGQGHGVDAGGAEHAVEGEDAPTQAGQGQGADVGRTSSVISLLHLLAIKQQQQQNQEVQDRQQAAAGPRPPPLQQQQPAQQSSQQPQQQQQAPSRGLRQEEVTVKAEPNGMDAAMGGDGRLYAGDGNTDSLPRPSHSSQQPHPPQQQQQQHQQLSTGQARQQHVQPRGPQHQPPLRFDGPTGPGAGAPLHRQQSYSSRERSLAAAVAAAAAAAGGTDAMQVDSPPHEGAEQQQDRVTASLATIERKLLLQEERLVYELKQVRLMQKLLQVQQMKHMVREAMRTKQRDAAMAGAEAEHGAPTPQEGGQPFAGDAAAAAEGLGPAFPPSGPGAAPSQASLAALLAATGSAPGMGQGLPQGVSELLEAEGPRGGAEAAAAGAPRPPNGLGSISREQLEALAQLQQLLPQRALQLQLQQQAAQLADAEQHPLHQQQQQLLPPPLAMPQLPRRRQPHAPDDGMSAGGEPAPGRDPGGPRRDAPAPQALQLAGQLMSYMATLSHGGQAEGPTGSGAVAGQRHAAGGHSRRGEAEGAHMGSAPAPPPQDAALPGLEHVLQHSGELSEQDALALKQGLLQLLLQQQQLRQQ